MNSAPILNAEEQALLDKIPPDGSNIGNITVRRALGWDEAKYWPIRDSLYTKGYVGLFRCRGGGVRRIFGLTATPTVTARAAHATESQKSESEYYADLETTLREQWAKDMGLENYLVQVTAQQGRRDTGGAWTRPDIVLVSVTNYRYIPGRQLDVNTFEVKLADQADIKAVYEALAHCRASTSAYLLLVGSKDCTADDLEQIKREAARHGVGLIRIKDPKNFDEWDYIIEPRSTLSDPASIEEFIETQLSDENKRKISLWVK